LLYFAFEETFVLPSASNKLKRSFIESEDGTMPTSDIRFDPGKLQELILWIAAQAPDIGLTKLEKLLYLCDFIAAEKTGKSITGEMYRHFDRGPVPKDIMPILAEMYGKSLDREEKPLKNKPGKFIKLKPRRRCDASKFTAPQKQIINEVIEHFGELNAKQLVDYVHGDLTYKATKRNEDIPYSLALYRRYQKPDRKAAEELKNDPDYIESLRAAL
jgi:uncharacterized phage-associated protein